MPKIVIIGSDNLELLKQLIANETIHQQLAEQGEYIDVPVVEQFIAEQEAVQGYAVESDEPTDLLEDEDLPLIVQIRLEDEIELSPGFTMKKWVDTNIEPDDLEEYRARFPEQEYRLVAVYDEIVTEYDESVNQETISAEDEIGQLKAEVLKLKSIIANYEADDNAQ